MPEVKTGGIRKYLKKEEAAWRDRTLTQPGKGGNWQFDYFAVSSISETIFSTEFSVLLFSMAVTYRSRFL